MKRNFFAFVILPLAALFVYVSCAKIDATDIGGGLIPPIDNINTFETTLEVNTDNKLFNDTSRMLKDEDHAIGIIEDDPEFGKTSASLYASFSPLSYGRHPFTNNSSVIVDSVILSLAYTRTYGDSNSVQQFEVREIDPSQPFRDTLYYLNSPDFPVLSNLIGSSSVNFIDLGDSIMYRNIKDTVRTGKELRIPLDTSFARRFIEYDTLNAYKSDSIFKLNFKGLEVKVNEGASPLKHGLAYFELEDNTRTKITFYCRIQNNGKTDTIAPVFAYTFDPAANIVRRQLAHSYLETVNNATPNDSKLYIQSTPGSYATITIPGLPDMDNRVIHKAELIAETAPSEGDNIYTAPPTLFLDCVNAAGDSTFTVRNDFIQANAFPGYDLASLGGILKNNRYVFNVTRYVQSIVTKKYPSYILRISAPFITRPYYIPPNDYRATSRALIMLNVPVASGRTVLYGGGTPTDNPKRLRLRIIYSKI